MIGKERESLKTKLNCYKSECHKFFLRQGAFSLHHSQHTDVFLKNAYELVLKYCFEDFLPSSEKIPFCLLASKAYAQDSLCINEDASLLFVYKDIKAFHLKPMIKTFIELLNDISLPIDCVILELDGVQNTKRIFQNSFIQTRFICGSKPLYKSIKEKFQIILQEKKNEFATLLLENFTSTHLPFLKQEFNIKRDFGCLNHLRALEALLSLFKEGTKNYALSFVDEKALSELRLAGDFLLSLQCALNLQSQKDENMFLLSLVDELSTLMYKKDKKNVKAKDVLIQKALQSRHTIGFWTHFLAMKIQEVLFQKTQEKKYTFTTLCEALEFLLHYEDKNCDFEIELVFALRTLSLSKKESEKAFALFIQIFYRKNSFCLLKLLLDSKLLKDLCKPFWTVRFLSDEESDYSFDEQAFLTLKELEKQQEQSTIFQALTSEEKMITKLSTLLSAITNENEISMASIYRSYCAKFDLNNECVEFGLRLFKNFNALKELIEKEDIFNPLIISALLSKVENSKTLELLSFLTECKAKALCLNDFFHRSLKKLLQNAKEGFEDSNLLDETARRVKKELTLKRTKSFLELDALSQDKIVHIQSNLFIIKNSFEDIISISQKALKSDFKFWFENKQTLKLQIIAKKGFSPQVVLVSLSSLNLISMNFFELFDEKIYLEFEYNNVITDTQTEKLCTLLNSNFHNILPKKIQKPYIKKDELKFNKEYSKIYAKLGLNTKDQQGLMAFVMSVFEKLGLNLCTAKIQTIRNRTRNIFIFEKNENMQNLEKKLLDALISE
ncbi:nucleotidyltransferase [Campylobacter sp. MIT 21-1685]|uniref:nucleotidyltransferase n=1 Tax=unclassified Campylobacter TaxID=2593542 RepID=UPI00224B2512|nr:MULTISPECIES: nucleotidyltransferase [unclassified Campylobacter]MCX2683173.1 nucleotidyltransferase [Campylobacter sp. MIT 21-1684]MCX2751507.1 nucleotidyltransferase [Campylobacter sp. MIT 21-1682]MCX2807654.1 nucleotidyltransferase [Campylobacter sp. MIT 21-1685]